jgi:hypothetical protein
MTSDYQKQYRRSLQRIIKDIQMTIPQLLRDYHLCGVNGPIFKESVSRLVINRLSGPMEIIKWYSPKNFNVVDQSFIESNESN